MKNERLWLIWIPLIILLILMFPKSCGFQNPSESVSYKCYGFKTPFLSEIKKTDNLQQWCSGICASKSININPLNQKNQAEEQTPFSGLTDSFAKVIPSLLIVFIIIGVLKWFGSLKNKNKGEEIRVYRNP